MAHKLKKAHRYRLRFKEREFFTENLALLLRSAVPVGEALGSLQVTATSGRMKKALKQMMGDIEAGRSLADALDRSGIVSHQTLTLVRLGESSGKLVDNLQLAAQQEEKRQMFRAKVRSAMIYPSFVLGLTLIVGLGISWLLLPRLANTFSQLQVELPLISKIAINFGIFLQQYGIIAVPAFLIGTFLFMYLLFGAPYTKKIGQRLLLKMPGIGKLMKEVEIAQFGYLLSTLMNAGLPVTQALSLLASATQAPQYQRFYAALGRSLENGYSFQDSLVQYRRSRKLLPGAVRQMIVAGERSGSLPEVLETVGRTYEQKSDVSTANLEALIEPILLVIVWIGVMLVAIAVIVPVYSLVGGLQS
jgi:MSHA biogenesis protein MshG